MATINLYRIDSEKKQNCLKELDGNSSFEKKVKKTSEKKEVNRFFRPTLYLEKPQQNEAGISWNWILNEFGEPDFQTFKAPKAVLLLEEIETEDTEEAEVEDTEEIEAEDTKKTEAGDAGESGTNIPKKVERHMYAITFGSSYFKIDKFCDRDFGFDFAARMEYTNVKTTTLMAPNLTRNKTVNTYINCSDLEFSSGESFSKLKVNAKIEENATPFKPAMEIGTSIRFTIDKGSIDAILDVILYVEETLKISTDEVKYKIPLFKPVREESKLDELNKKLNQTLIDVLANNKSTTDENQGIDLLSIPELEIIGATEVFNHTDDEFKLKYKRSNFKEVSNLTISTIKEFCKENNIDSIEDINKIHLIRYRNDERVATLKLKDIIEYTDDEEKCIFNGGKWHMFNQDYLTYLNDSIKEISVEYKKEYDFNDEIHNQFIEKQYNKEKNLDDYRELTDDEIKKKLKRKYYVERCFNMLRAETKKFENHDRENTTEGFEKMDLYEKETKTMLAVKKGSASSGLCYAVDQSLTALSKLKHGEMEDINEIKNVGLWFILEKKKPLSLDENGVVDLTSLNMLMLKNRIDQWKKEVRLAGLKPIIYINYRNMG